MEIVNGSEHLYAKYITPNDCRKIISDNNHVNWQNLAKYCLMYNKFGTFCWIINRMDIDVNYEYRFSHSKNTATLLSICVQKGFLIGINKLLKKGANMHQLVKNIKGENVNLLQLACETADLKTIKYLLLKGIYPDKNALKTSLCVGNALCVKQLLSSKIKSQNEI